MIDELDNATIDLLGAADDEGLMATAMAGFTDELRGLDTDMAPELELGDIALGLLGAQEKKKPSNAPEPELQLGKIALEIQAEQEKNGTPDVRSTGISATPDVRSHEIRTEQSMAQASRLIGLGDRLPVELPGSVDELKAWLIDQENHLAREAARQGFGFLVLKQELGDGEFSGWLTANDFKEQRVYEHIGIAKMLLAAPAGLQPQLMGMSKHKLIELARLPEETIAEVAESGQLDELSRLSVRELKDQVRLLKTREQSIAADLEAAQEQNETLLVQVGERRLQEGIGSFGTAFIRDTALAEDWIDRGLTELRVLHAELIDHPIDALDPRSQRKWDAIAAHLYTSTACLYGRLRTLLNQLQEDLPESALGGLALADSRLSDGQVEDIVLARQTQARQADQERSLREAEARLHAPKKRGRPAKTAN